ncbi:MAG: heavy-metal-associated domain-containing protein [Anaerolineales bacterium]|jgi:copper chaperone CopZ
MTSVTYTVPNISCLHCIHTIQSEVGGLSGVRQVEADLATKEVRVAFDAPATEDQILSLLKEINYAPAGT